MEERLVSDGSDNNYRYNNERQTIIKKNGGRVGCAFVCMYLREEKTLAPNRRDEIEIKVCKKYVQNSSEA